MSQDLSPATLDMMRHLGIKPVTVKFTRVEPLPPVRAACDTLMDGDRLPAHMLQCSACAMLEARLEVSHDGANWMRYTGGLDGVGAFRHFRAVAGKPRTDDSGNMERSARHALIREVGEKLRASPYASPEGITQLNKYVDEACRNVIERSGINYGPAGPPPIPQVVRVAPPTCDTCGRLGAQAPEIVLRWVKHVDVVRKEMCCRDCYLSRERASRFAGKFTAPVLNNHLVPALLSHAAPPLAHSYGVEDPALPDA